MKKKQQKKTSRAVKEKENNNPTVMALADFCIPPKLQSRHIIFALLQI